MSFLDSLTINQKEVLISLPYRVGLWISKSDETGGDAATQEELQVLSNIIDGFADEVFGSENVQHIMSEAVSRKEQWPNWATQLETVLPDCTQAMDILSEHSDEKDVHAFQNHLMEIGQAVALAFREYEQSNSNDKMFLQFIYGLGKLKAALLNKPYVSRERFFNVSRAERKALSDLAGALGTTSN